MAKIIVIGNEKGGSGKTTISMHLIISLLKLGFKVGSIDLDRQQSLTRYLENRSKTIANRGDNSLLMPEHKVVQRTEGSDLNAVNAQEKEAFESTVKYLSSCDFIVVDTPGSDSNLSRIAHINADIVITPINDSFLDLDLLGIVSPDNLEALKPGIYSAMVWEQKMKKAAQKAGEMDWFVVRNRLSTLDAINKRNVENAVAKLSKRFGFKIAPGFGDRVVFKELFLTGLTLHDAMVAKEIKTSTSVVAARQELRNFLMALNLPEINEKINAGHQDVGSQTKIAANG